MNKAPLALLVAAAVVVMGVLWTRSYDSTEVTYADDDPRFHTEPAFEQTCSIMDELLSGEIETSAEHVRKLLQMVKAAQYTKLSEAVDEMVVITLDPSNMLATPEGLLYVEDRTMAYEDHIYSTCNDPTSDVEEVSAAPVR